MHTTVAELGTPSKSLGISETRTFFNQSTNPAFMIFFLLTSPWTKKSLDVNIEYSFAALPPEQNDQNKNMDAHDRIPSDPANCSQMVNPKTT
jgi:hypothetical protein